MKNVYIAPKDYTVNSINPFTDDGSYDRTWSLFIVDETVQGMIFSGKSPFGCYCIRATPKYKYFNELMADVLQYETDNGRKVIFVTDGEENKYLDNITTTYNDSIIRKSDPRFLVHSTMMTTYDKIVGEGLLKSPNRLRKEGYIIHAIGLEPLGEPDNYLDYVMFADGGIAPEFVINSRLCGYVNCDPNAKYIPQARMYFDCYKIIHDGIIVRDVGRKVYDNVPLSKYLIKTVFQSDVNLPDSQDYWTPLSFSSEADKQMNNFIRDRV